ncbi:tetratricopeptide repeat protein [Bradyrhizobium sp. WSM1417]|uniref:tetratricopeptide repeat protein n=1 Tax=Bradyrhizobium sp. WSM1417 TaxID=754500 RepID=UPI0012EB1D9C|nr:hypothetical protein [Bradyrhizobium sp. WSM1417]
MKPYWQYRRNDIQSNKDNFYITAGKWGWRSSKLRAARALCVVSALTILSGENALGGAALEQSGTLSQSPTSSAATKRAAEAGGAGGIGSPPPAARSADASNTGTLSDKDLFKKGEDAIDRDDYRLAFPYFQELANRGNAPAQYILGILFLDGNGVAQDGEQARYWLSKESAQGYERATKKLTELGVKTVPGGNGAPSNSGAQQHLAQSADTPTDEDIVELTRNRLREDSREAVRAHYGNLDKLGSGDVLQVIQGTTHPIPRKRCFPAPRMHLRKR